MTKHKIGSVTRNTPCLAKIIFSDEVIKIFTTVDRCLFSVVNGNGYLHRGSKENVLSTTITGNITISR